MNDLRKMRCWLLIGSLALAGCLRPADTSQKGSNIETLAVKAIDRYAAELAKSFRQGAQDVRRDETLTIDSLHRQLASRNHEARESAFRELDEALEREMGGGDWNRTQTALLLEQIAQGLEGRNR